MSAGIALFACMFLAIYEVVESPSSTLFGPTVTHGPIGHHVVALTFDDGPTVPYTASILDVLHKARAHATFFVVGFAAQAHPELLRRMVAQGDAVGAHSWNHSHLNLMIAGQLERDLAQTDGAIFAATGQRVTLVRPPFGARTTLVLDRIRARGETCVLWSQPLSHDWERPGVDVIVHRVLDNVHDGDIIVLHDGDRGNVADRSQTVAALPAIIRGLRAQGLEPVTVTSMLAYH